MTTFNRWILGEKYVAIAKRLEEIEKKPEMEWTEDETKRVVSLLEYEAELDLELTGYLIQDGDAVGMHIFNQNASYNAERLWNLKQRLAS